MLELGNFGTVGGNQKIIGKGSFIECLEELKKGNCDSIYGPRGGILIIDGDDSVVYESDGKAPQLGVKCYLGTWRMLKNREIEVQAVLHQVD